MKKAVAVLLTVLMIISLCACGKNTAPTEESTADTTQTTAAQGSTEGASTADDTTAEAGESGNASSATTAAAATTASGNGSGAEDTVAIEDFMGTWHYSDEEMKATWTMEMKGDNVEVTLSGTFADGQEMSQTEDCTYKFNNGVLELYSDEYEGGKLTLRFSGKDQLTATVNSDTAETITMKR